MGVGICAADYKQAYDGLSKMLYLDFDYFQGESLADGARRRKFKSRGHTRMNGRAYALLAATAYETGHEEVAREALEEAEKRGAEMAQLAQLLPG